MTQELTQCKIVSNSSYSKVIDDNSNWTWSSKL